MSHPAQPIIIFAHAGKIGKVGTPLLLALELFGYQLELSGDTPVALDQAMEKSSARSVVGLPKGPSDWDRYEFVLLINPDVSAGQRLFDAALAAKREVIVVFDRARFDLSYSVASLLAAGPPEVYAYLYLRSNLRGLSIPSQSLQIGSQASHKQFWNWLQIVAPFSKALSGDPKAWTREEQLSLMREGKSCVLTRAIGVGLLKPLPMEGADLAGIDWKFGRFVDFQFADATFRGSRIEQIWCLRGNFTRANFENATVAVSKFSGSQFERARFNGATIEGAYLNQCTGRESTWDESKLARSDLRLSRFEGSSWKNVSFQSCRMQNASFAFADALGSVFEDVIMDGADFSGARLDHARGKRVDAAGMKLQRASLAKSRWEFCELPGLEAASSDLSGSAWINCNLDGANLQGANLRGADLTGVLLTNADLTGANLEHAKLNGSNLYNTNLAGANLAGAEFGDVPLRLSYFDDTQRERLAQLVQDRIT